MFLMSDHMKGILKCVGCPINDINDSNTTVFIAIELI
jgi:cytochrome c-type biogenesis protein CcmH/NrfF